MASSKIAPIRPKHISQAEQEKLSLSLRRLNYIQVDYKTKLLREIKKRDADQTITKLSALETTQKFILNKTGFIPTRLVLLEAGKEMLEEKFTANCLALIYLLANMLPIQMEKQMQRILH
jgi:hypothetical protein